jgi:tRNA(adenine34) deaminase
MCAGAILQARVSEVVYGAPNPKAGCAGSIYNLLQDFRFNHYVEVKQGVRESECAGIMKQFFKNFRNKEK